MDIRLICMDLDGTALQADKKTFSPRLIRALEKAHEKGVAIIPVTGRQYGLLPPAVQDHPVWEDLVVTCNGGQIRKLATGEVLYSLNIEEGALRQLLDISERFGIPVEFSVDSHLHLTQRSYDAELPHAYLNFHVHTILAKCGVIIDSLEPLCTQPIEKVMLPWITPDIAADVEHALKDVAVSAVWASDTSIEITHPDASKGHVLGVLCDMLGIPEDKVMVLGDSGNDESILRRAGLGIAMGNAPAHIRAIADAVTASHTEDGAAIAIEKYCL